MRRDTFLKSLAAMAAVGALPLSARAAANVKMMIPANPGGGWDTTGRAIGRALVAACPQDKTLELIANAPLERFTDRTVLDRDAIAADIALTAERGFAFVEGEFEAGVSAVATPVRSITTTLARCARIACSRPSVSCLAR